jgi:rSAM/selenodomain-associated transferase 2
MSQYNLSIIVPVLNEAAQCETLIRRLLVLSEVVREIIIVDGGSTDNTKARLATHFTVLDSSAGRARQMNVGANYATGTWLFFLHADTSLGLENIHFAIRESATGSWGRFDVRLSGQRFMFRIIAALMNMRSRFTGVATGDQCIFVRKKLFDELGGYAEIALMEDVELSKRLKRYAAPVCLASKVVTSSRRWSQFGIWKTIFLMWKLRFLFWWGVDPDKLNSLYRGH